MPGTFKRTLVTAALPYANGPKHIGHLAGAYLPADIYVRHLRQEGEEVIFVCGSDEHGTAIQMQALEEKTTPEAIVDKYHYLLKSNFENLGISFDVYHRTSNLLHHETAKEIFIQLYEKGCFTETESEQYYDAEAGRFLADRYIKGECPNCHSPDAYGDQCEKCGKSLNASDLINPRSTLSGNKPELRKTKHWYLPLQDYEPWLKTWLLQGHREWKANTYGQCKSWIDAGLAPRAMTRDMDWGVKVPLPQAAGKVLYVWFDAPIGYISATKAFFREMESGQYEFAYPANSVIKKAKATDWEVYWKDKDTRLIHFIGKDNIVFHGITFPCVLHAAGDFIVPDNVPANEFLNLEGDKMSTSRKWSIEMEDYLAAFESRQDELRYMLTAISPETKDSDFSWKDFQTRNNSELVAIFGNFVNRVLTLCHKHCSAAVPLNEAPTAADEKLMLEIERISKAIDKNIRSFHFRDAQSELMNLARAGNKYLAEQEPWKEIKINEKRAHSILFYGVQVCAKLAYASLPFLPFTSERLMSQLGIAQLSELKNNNLPSGKPLGQPKHLFTPIEDEVINLQLENLLKNKPPMETQEPATSTGSGKPEINYEDFSKLDLRTGIITAAEKVEKADKLLKLDLDMGDHRRTVVSGIAEHFKAEEIIGRQVTVVANLMPRKLKGIESKGMILMAHDASGKLVFINPDEPVAPGSEIS